jgi:TetR/AcrR family transcriptional regulator, transcriptional repressor for nem operon
MERIMIKKGELTREKILSTAVDIINIKGYSNTSINDIINETGVKKGNIYFHFSSKEKLVKSIILEARKDYLEYLTSRIKGDKPVQKLDSLIFAIYSFHRKKKFTGGCLFGNIALELADLNPEISTTIKEIFNEWISIFSDFLNQAVKEGEIKIRINPAMTARHIIASIEGGIMMSKLSKDGSDMSDCIKSIYLLLGIKSEYFKI